MRVRQLSRVVFALILLIGLPLGLGAFVFTQFRPAAITIGQRVLLFQDPGEVNNWMALNVHEDAHRAQYREYGLVGYLARYLASSDQRLAWEMEARRAELCYRVVTRVTAPQVSWQYEAQRLARYTSRQHHRPDSAEIRAQLEGELSAASCSGLLERIGVQPLPRAGFPADGVLQGLLSDAVVNEFAARLWLHTHASPWMVSADSVVRDDSVLPDSLLSDTLPSPTLALDSLPPGEAATFAWEVVTAAPLARSIPAGGAGLWSRILRTAKGSADQGEARSAVSALDTLEIASFRLLARSNAAPWLARDLAPEMWEFTYVSDLLPFFKAWHARVLVAIAEQRYSEAEQASREMLTVALRVTGSTLDPEGRQIGAWGVRQALETLLGLRRAAGDDEAVAALRLALRGPEQGDSLLPLLDTRTAMDFHAGLTPLLGREDLPPALRWDLVSTGYALARCGNAGTTGVPDETLWINGVARRMEPWERGVIKRIQAWPRDPWHCAGIADRYAKGWQRPLEQPPVNLSWVRSPRSATP